MSTYNWINGSDFSFRHFFLMDRWLLTMIFKRFEGLQEKDLNTHDKTLSMLLQQEPILVWFIKKKAPEATQGVDFLLCIKTESIDKDTMRAREVELMEHLETDIIYTEPEVMATSCNYITAWDEKYLYELVDLKDKVVLDLGAGTGRLTFAAQKVAQMVYASEPVDRLREYMRDRIKAQKIKNVRVTDGVIERIPYEDNTFDVVISGHVVGDNYDAEIKEMTRVIKANGTIVICNGDDDIKRKGPNPNLVERGFKAYYHQSSLQGDIYNYTKTVSK